MVKRRERHHSSTYRELTAVLLSLESFASDLTSHTVAWFTDNQNVVSIIEKGSIRPGLQMIALKNFNLFCALSDAQIKHPQVLNLIFTITVSQTDIYVLGCVKCAS